APTGGSAEGAGRSAVGTSSPRACPQGRRPGRAAGRRAPRRRGPEAPRRRRSRRGGARGARPLIVAGPRDGDQGYTPEGDMSRLDKEGLVKRVLGVLLVVGAAVCLTVSASARTDHTAVSVNQTRAGTGASNPPRSQRNNPAGSALCTHGITCRTGCADRFNHATSLPFTA